MKNKKVIHPIDNFEERMMILIDKKKEKTKKNVKEY